MPYHIDPVIRRLRRDGRHDTRFAYGDDFESDARVEIQTNKIVRVGVGQDPNLLDMPDLTPDPRQLPLWRDADYEYIENWMERDRVIAEYDFDAFYRVSREADARP